MLYYKLLGKRIAFTAHNVNAAKRDARDSWMNRITLKAQYRLADHIFVHTEKMKGELMSEYDVAAAKISIIPFGINNTIPNTKLTSLQAKTELGLSGREKVLLFFGNITPYKGLEYLVAALEELIRKGNDCRLVIAGRPKVGSDYWSGIQKAISREGLRDRIIKQIEYIPDEKVELYFKAADVLVLPYSHIFQSGVLFLGYSFGLPVIAADVGSLKEDVIEGTTGFVFRPEDSKDLAKVIESYFSSDLFQQLERHRGEIRAYANERHSWSKVGEMTRGVYARLLEG
jgi:glycosyltransferase involved in cell wall biosynthesis